MSKIISINAREILASGGEPTLEVLVKLESGAVGEASVSYGASAGSKEAMVIFDEDEGRYGGRGMERAMLTVEEVIGPKLVGMEAENQREIDEKMLEMDGTENKSVLGGNAMLGVSMAVARAAASELGIPLWKYLRETYEINPPIASQLGRAGLPKPMVVMIEGGKHADQTTDLQEYLVSAMGSKTAKENVRMVMEIYGELKKILKREGLSTNVGNEGAFAPNGIKSNEKPIEYIIEAIKNAGYEPGVEAGISLDAAASEFGTVEVQNKKVNYELKLENKTMSSEELINYFGDWIEKYPFVSWEDMLSEYDWENWPKMMEKIDDRLVLIADDLTVTNKDLWQEAIEKKAANAILIKLNQAGTVTETIDCCKLAIEKGLWTVVSHRGGGESNDTFMVDLAVAVGAEYIKCGPTRGERVAKYNRLMRIEEEINN